MTEKAPLFRAEALESRARPEGIGERIQVVRPKDGLALAALTLLTGAALLWAVLGSVRVTAVGQGMLLRSDALARLAGPSRVAKGAPGGHVLQSLDPPKLVQRIAQLREEMRLAEELALESLALRESGFEAARASIARQDAQIARRIEALEALGAAQLGAARKAESQRAGDIEVQRASAREVLARREAQLTRTIEGARSGILSEQEVTRAYAERLEAAAAVDALTREAAELRTESVAASLAQEDIGGRIESLRAQREGLEVEALRIDREAAEAHGVSTRELALLAQELEQAELELSIRQIDAPDADPSAAGASSPGDEDGLVVVIFMDAAQAKRVAPQMELRVLPDSVEVERFGAAVGRVTEVTTYPVTPAQAEVLLGNDALAAQLAESGRSVLLIGKLESAATPSGVRWTSSKGPNLVLSPGTTLAAHVTVERRRPIGFLLPFLRRITGVDDR